MFKFIERLFKGRTPASTEVETAPLTEEQLKSVTYEPISYRPPQFVVGCAQSVGKVRDHNEDTMFTMSSVLSDNETELPFGLFMIADGMGGHQHGEVASGIAVRTMSEYLVSRLFSPLFGTRESQGESLQELMQNGVYEAQQAVLRKAPGGGTTLSVAMVIGEQITISHVGDSRVYFLYPDGRVQVITHDHSLVRRLIELGQLTEEEAAVHPQRNVLYRAIGQVEPFKPDITTYPFPNQAMMMLCSDGLWSVVSEMEILRIIRSATSLNKACQDLIAAANASGGPDNISVILVQYLD